MGDKSILLVDDEENILASIGWFLKKNHFRVTTAPSGREAIKTLKKQKFDLVITDLVMAEVDGIAVLKEAKSLDPDIGVIILTGYADVATAVKTLKLGADDYLQKPCDIDDLISKTRRSFEKRDLMGRLRNKNEQLKTAITAQKVAELKLQDSHDTLERQVEKRTSELSATLYELQTVLQAVVLKERELQKKNRELHDANAALNIMLKRREHEHIAIRKEIAAKTLEMVLPLLKKAYNMTSGAARQYIETAQVNLQDAFSKHRHDDILVNAKLSPRELQVVHYIRQGKTSKEIADLLGLSTSTVVSYRENIRKKLRVKNKKINLRKFVTSLP